MFTVCCKCGPTIKAECDEYRSALTVRLLLRDKLCHRHFMTFSILLDFRVELTDFTLME